MCYSSSGPDTDMEFHQEVMEIVRCDTMQGKIVNLLTKMTISSL